VNPYGASKTPFAAASRKDKIDTVCGQCHVEYVCGKSGVDGVDRDHIPWAKVGDLEAIYLNVFPTTDKYGIATYGMDWIHGAGVRSSAWPNYAPEYPIGVPLIKNQHPETELYWESAHYRAGLSCAECHLPTVTRSDGTTFRSHWFASPLKYLDQLRASAFAATFGLKLPATGVINGCTACHTDSAAERSAAVVALQDTVYGQAVEVQDLLVQSLQAINSAEATGTALSSAKLTSAIEKHRSAHVRWENLAVSENSMGFHNAEASAELTKAKQLAQEAIADARAAQTTTSTASPPSTTTTTTAGTTTSTRSTTTSTTAASAATSTTVPTGEVDYTG
jgi:nitrite reductase (cytochrome c-552)